MKKSIFTATLALSLGFAGFLYAPETHATNTQGNTTVNGEKRVHSKETPPTNKSKAFKQPKRFHEGETPVKTVVDEKTGVVVEVYDVKKPQSGFSVKGAGEWDYLGSDQWYMDGNFSKKQYDKVFSSGGGDYMVRVPAHKVNTVNGSAPWIRIELWEDDSPGDDYVGAYEGYSYTLETRDYVWRDVGDFVDGSAAEFYTVHQANYTVWNTLWAGYWD